MRTTNCKIMQVNLVRETPPPDLDHEHHNIIGIQIPITNLEQA